MIYKHLSEYQNIVRGNRTIEGFIEKDILNNSKTMNKFITQHKPRAFILYDLTNDIRLGKRLVTKYLRDPEFGQRALEIARQLDLKIYRKISNGLDYIDKVTKHLPKRPFNSY